MPLNIEIKETKRNYNMFCKAGHTHTYTHTHFGDGQTVYIL